MEMVRVRAENGRGVSRMWISAGAPLLDEGITAERAAPSVA
jgi:hypothetical protein